MSIAMTSGSTPLETLGTMLRVFPATAAQQAACARRIADVIEFARSEHDATDTAKQAVCFEQMLTTSKSELASLTSHRASLEASILAHIGQAADISELEGELLATHPKFDMLKTRVARLEQVLPPLKATLETAWRESRRAALQACLREAGRTMSELREPLAEAVGKAVREMMQQYAQAALIEHQLMSAAL